MKLKILTALLGLLSLKGYGQTNKAVTPATVQHGINVTWIQGTCTGCTAASNNVYSAATSAGPFSFVGSSTTLAYLDPMTSLNQGKQSCYVVTMVDTQGIESGQSTPPVCQTFPVQPGIPSSVSAAQQ